MCMHLERDRIAKFCLYRVCKCYFHRVCRCCLLSSRYSYSFRTCLFSTYPFCTYVFRPKNSFANVPHYTCTCDLCVCVYVCKMMISVYVWCVCVYRLVLHMLYGTAAWIPEKLPFSLYKYSYMNIYILTHNVYRWNTKMRPGPWGADGPRASLTRIICQVEYEGERELELPMVPEHLYLVVTEIISSLTHMIYLGGIWGRQGAWVVDGPRASLSSPHGNHIECLARQCWAIWL